MRCMIEQTYEEKLTLRRIKNAIGYVSLSSSNHCRNYVGKVGYTNSVFSFQYILAKIFK